MIKQLKETAKKAGLPADAAESWIRNKAESGKLDAEDLVSLLEPFGENTADTPRPSSYKADYRLLPDSSPDSQRT